MGATSNPLSARVSAPQTIWAEQSGPTRAGLPPVPFKAPVSNTPFSSPGQPASGLEPRIRTRKSVGEGAGLMSPALLLQTCPWGTWRLLWESRVGSPHAPIPRQGGPGQDAAICAHTHVQTHTHTHTQAHAHTHSRSRTSPAWHWRGDGTTFLSEDCPGKLPSLSQLSLMLGAG